MKRNIIITKNTPHLYRGSLNHLVILFINVLYLCQDPNLWQLVTLLDTAQCIKT